MRAALVGFALLIVPALMIADVTNNPLQGWKEFTPKDKSFSVHLPDKGGKRYERERVLLVKGARIKVNLVELELNDGAIYTASAVILPLEITRKIPQQERIEIVRDAIVKDVTGKIDGESDIKQGRVAGKEYVISTGQGLVKLRLYALGGRVYQARVQGTKEQVQSRDATAFLDSYKLPAAATEENPKGKDDPKTVDPKKDPKTTDPPIKIGNLPEWTTDLAKMKFPESAAAGKLLGQDFQVDSVKLEASGALTLSRGKGIIPDASIMVFLKPGEAVEGKTYEIRKDTPPTQRMPIHVRVMIPGQKAPAAKAFVQDYAMKLEFGKAKDGVIQGRIYVCLPDDGGSVVAGTFTLKR